MQALGPDPCCVTWFITSVSVECLSHQRFFLYTQGERWASLSAWEVRGKICHHAIHINSSGTTSGGLHLSCFYKAVCSAFFQALTCAVRKELLGHQPLFLLYLGFLSEVGDTYLHYWNSLALLMCISLKLGNSHSKAKVHR